MKKKIVATTIAMGMVLSCLAVAPVNERSTKGLITTTSIAHAEDQVSNRLASLLAGVYGNITDYSAFAAVHTKMNSVDTDWQNIITNGIQVPTSTGVTEGQVVNMIKDLAEVFFSDTNQYSEAQFESRINTFRSNYNVAFDLLFGTSLTVEELFNFTNDVIEYILNNESLLISFFIDPDKTFDDVVAEAVAAVKPNYPNLDGALSDALGIGVTQLLSLRTTLNAELDPNNEARDAFIMGAARENAGFYTGSTKVSGSVNMYPGDDLSYQVMIGSTLIDASFAVDWTSSNPSVAAVDGDTLEANNLGSTNVTVKIRGKNIVLDTITVNVIQRPTNDPDPETGTTPDSGDNNSETPPDEDLVPDITYEEIQAPSSVNEEDGEAIVTVNTSALINDINANTDSKNIEINVTNTADVIVAILDYGLITAIANNNEESIITLNTSLGQVILPVTQLREALKDFGTNAQVEFKIEKASAGVASTISSVVSSNGAELLTTPIVTNLVVVDGDDETTVESFSGYVSTTVSLNGTFNANNVAVVEIINEDTQVTKDKGVTIAAVGLVKYVPVPAIVVSAKGKTEVTMKQLRNGTFAVVENSVSFPDVGATHWAKPYIEILGSKFIISGRDNGKFDPSGTITRAEMVTLIVKALGLAPDVSASSFADVKADKWYAGAVGAASKAGLVVGYNNNFNPEDKVTRQEAAVILMKAIKLAGGKIEVTDKEQTDLLAKFSDKNEIDSWARVDMAKAVKAKLLSGHDTGELAPRDSSTRAEAAVMIKAFMVSVGLINVDSTHD